VELAKQNVAQAKYFSVITKKIINVTFLKMSLRAKTPRVMVGLASALKMETARFFETLASTNQSTRRINPKEHNQKGHSRENLKSHIM
jgi:CTP:phosphocholine cytidylyltransferase-like protein